MTLTSVAAGTRSGRLDGWEQIASHCGRSVRTCQRWEKDLLLPVHRMGRPSGEIVFAFASELDSWLRLAERRTAGERRRTPLPVPAVQAKSRLRALAHSWLGLSGRLRGRLATAIRALPRIGLAVLPGRFAIRVRG